ncbi:hypothetical protein [Mycobacterium sp. 852002-51961_SCH5331710]|uniref:hypothetical protein n=1 Tax=Mycobacterium sp. 852002-51961_SCH5331710 TaxID=1834105 RepID=UPI000A746D21|nr:hypothetical protein [Mycobacterium sp. 852002-51961_SCH5331710]
MTVRFLRVLGARSRDATVLATVDNYLVRWRPRDGWTCTCDELEFVDCPHMGRVEELLDHRVLNKGETP